MNQKPEMWAVFRVTQFEESIFFESRAESESQAKIKFIERTGISRLNFENGLKKKTLVCRKI